MTPRLARLAIALWVTALAGPVRAQAFGRGWVEPSPRTFELTPQAGMFWSGPVSGSIGRIAFDVAPEAALAADFQVDARSQVELLYLFARPQARFTTVNPSYASSPSFAVTTQALQVGGLTAFDVGKVEPFLAGGLGIAWYHPDALPATGTTTIVPADAVLFAFHLGGGVKWWLSDSIGLRLGARILFPVLFSGGAFLSTGEGAAMFVNAGIPTLQGDLTLGLAIAP